MAWVSPKVYAILSSSEEGKDILQGIAEKSQEEVDKELDAFFGNGGKGASKGKEYANAKASDKEENDRYESYSDEEAQEAWKTQKETQAEYENRRKNGSEGDGTAEEYERAYGLHPEYRALEDEIESLESKDNVTLEEYRNASSKLNKLQREGKITDEEYADASNWLAKIGNDQTMRDRKNSEIKEIYGQMTNLRTREQEEAQKLVEAWADKRTMTEEEFKEKSDKLHKETQDQINALYDKIRERKESLANEMKVNDVTKYFKLHGRPSRNELQDVVKHYGLTRSMATEVFENLGIDREDYENIEYGDGLYYGGVTEDALRGSNDFKIKEYLKELDEYRNSNNPKKEFFERGAKQIESDINKRLKEIRNVPNDIYNKSEPKSSEDDRSIKKFLGSDGQVTDDNREAYQEHMDKYYGEANQLIKDAGMEDIPLSFAHGLKTDYAKGKISKDEFLKKYSDEYNASTYKKKGLVGETLLSKFNDAHLYNDGGKFQLDLSNGNIEEFDTYNKAIDRLSDYTKKDYSWAKKKQYGNWGITSQDSGKWRIDNTYDDYNSLKDAERAIDADPLYKQNFTQFALTPSNKKQFLKENGLSERYYFDGNNLIDKKTDQDTGIEIDSERGWTDKEKVLKEIERYEKYGVLPW